MLILDRYRPTYEAGSGGFATVVVATDTRMRREVAIKCLPLDEALSQSLSSEDINEKLRNFENPYAQDESVSILLDEGFVAKSSIPGLEEARTAAHLNDANIAAVYDFEIQGNMAYIIMELVDGMSLSDLIKHFPETIDADVVAAVFKAVSHALEVAHKNNVLHLDIKPDNVLINRDGQIKVVDFGLARLADGFGFGVAAGGTIGYMPPEQMEREELDERCDQWALASLIYELLSRGENPFKAPTVEEALDAIYDAEIIIPSLCMEDIDESLDEAIFRALDPDKEGRYPSVHAFARDAKPALGNPKQGTKKLAALVGYALSSDEDAEDAEAVYLDAFGEDEDDEANEGIRSKIYPLNLRRKNGKSRGGLFASGDDGVDSSRVSSRYSLVMRILALVGSVLIASVAFTYFSLLPGWVSPMLWGALLLVMVAAFALPHIGALISFSLLGLAFVNNNALLVGVLVVVATFLWWFFIGRGGSQQADAALLSVAGSAIGLGALTPLISAYFLRPLQAAGTALFTAIVALMLAGLGSVSITSWDIFQLGGAHAWAEVGANVLTTVQNPVTWAIIVSWVISAPLVSLFFARGAAALSIVGVVLGTIITCVLPAVASITFLAHSPDPIYILLTIVSGIIAAVLAVLFPPHQE